MVLAKERAYVGIADRETDVLAIAVCHRGGWYLDCHERARKLGNKLQLQLPPPNDDGTLVAILTDRDGWILLE